MSTNTNTKAAKSARLTKTKKAQRVGRYRAMWNKDGGGVLITAKAGANNQNGVHWSALIDGGNYWNGRYQWVAGTASGGGYDVRAAAMSEAVEGIAGTELQELYKSDEYYKDSCARLGWHNRGQWVEILGRAGWTAYSWDDGALALIPSDEIAAKIEAERKAEEVA